MIYNQFIKLCEINNTKPTPVLRSLGLSSGSLKSWKNGSGLNSDTLKALADYFDVPVEYFFAEKDSPDLLNISTTSYKEAMNVYAMRPTFFDDIEKSSAVNKGELEIIADYLGCNINIFSRSGVTVNDTETSYKRSDAFTLVLEILNTIATSKEYKELQCTLSSVIANNLYKLGISARELTKIGITSPYETPFSAFTLIHISKHFHLGLESIVTGKMLA